MSEQNHLSLLDQGVDVWNAWRKEHPQIRPDLSHAHLRGRQFRGIDLSHANLGHCDLRFTILSRADLTHADLQGADLRGASLRRAKLDHAFLSGAILRHASLAEASVDDAVFTGSEVYGLSAWSLRGRPRDQSDLIIRSSEEEAPILVNDIELAQLVSLMRCNEKIRGFIDTVTHKSVLVLGRFTPECKAVLDRLRRELHNLGYVPILFDFVKPASRNLTETVVLLAHLSRFVIADLTDPRCTPHELAAVLMGPLSSVPVVPLLRGDREPYAMFGDLAATKEVLPVVCYQTPDDLIARLKGEVIDPAEEAAERCTRRSASLAGRARALSAAGGTAPLEAS